MHFSTSSVFRRLCRDQNRVILGISLKNGRFQRLQNLLPQKLEGFADFAEILISIISTKFVCCVTSFKETQTSLSIIILRSLPFPEFVFFWIHVFEGFDVCEFQNSEGFKAPKKHALISQRWNRKSIARFRRHVKRCNYWP